MHMSDWMPDMTAVIPYMNITCNRLRDPLRYVDLMSREWVRLTLTNVGALNGIFLAACRHLLRYRHESKGDYVKLATQYKVLCMQALREAVVVEGGALISDGTVATNVLLTFDEVRMPDDDEKPVTDPACV